MKITIEITNEAHLVLLSRWASIGRTIESAKRACELAIEANPEDDRCKVALEELDSLHRPLEDLHTLVRNELWKAACGKFVKKMLHLEYTCRLEKGHAGPCRGF